MPERGARRSLTLLVAALALSLAACTSAPDERPAPPAPTPIAATATATPTAPPATATATPAPTPAPTETPVPSPTATPAPTSTAAPTPTPTEPPTTFRYDRYDTTGAVAEPGSYAFLADPADTSSVVTTYEGLRDGTATALLIHERDALGVSRAAFLDTVEVGDLFEWRQAEDCFVRYKVTELLPEPSGTPRRLLGVEWMTFAFTGCSGAIPANALATVDWAPANIQSPDITVPIRHGPWQLVPDDWTGAREDTVLVPTQHTEESYDVPAVRRHRLWREPNLPHGWRLHTAGAGFEGIDGVIATYVDAEGYIALDLQIQQLDMLGSRWSATTADPRTVIVETRIIDGHPAYVKYSPIDDRIHSTLVRIYNRATGVEYLVIGADPSLSGGNIDATIEIARSLLPSPTTFRYNTYDTSGAVAEPGSYAFLADPADTSSVVTTYEGLRDGTATALLIHERDALGVSRAAFLDTVEVGDLFEWRQAEDCFVRYKVTELLPEPSGTPRRLLGVEWMTFTYTGCSGAISASDNAQIVCGSLPNLGGESLSVPVIHGAYEIVPLDWSGETMRDYVPFPDYSDPVETDDITVARTLDFWREPTIPEGWTFGKAIAAGGDAYGGARWGYCATWWANDVKIPNTTVVHPQRGVQICADFTSTRYGNQDASWNNGSAVHETRVIAGRPASLRFSPPGPNHRLGFPTLIQVFDPTTGVTYEIEAIDYDLKSNPEAVVEMARSLFELPNPLPPPSAFRYDTYDTTGAVAEPGSYAFLANPADTASAVTTYEALRDGTTAALLIHKSDAHGASQAALYDAVEAGDFFEWRQAEDCFVRYKVTELLPEPSGTPRRLLGVEWMTFAFTGCSGPIAATAAVSVDWGELPDLGGVSLTAPVVHGVSQIVPAGWKGATRAYEEVLPSVFSSQNPSYTENLAEARKLRYWRDPDLPEGWRLDRAISGGLTDPTYGYTAEYVTADGSAAFTLKGYHAGTRYHPEDSFWSTGSLPWVKNPIIARETRMIAGRPASIVYSPPGPGHDVSAIITVWVYDVAAQSKYKLIGFDVSLRGANIDAVIAIARSLFESPNPE